MRVKDEIKQDALFEATVKLVNEIGFAASSVSKIAKQANVSPATLYVYHKNKEELLVSTYVRIKQFMGLSVQKNFDDSQPIRDILKTGLGQYILLCGGTSRPISSIWSSFPTPLTVSW